MPGIIDLAVTETEGGYHIEFLVLADADTERIRKICSEHDFAKEVRIVEKYDRLLYSGKRVIHHHSYMV